MAKKDPSEIRIEEQRRVDALEDKLLIVFAGIKPQLRGPVSFKSLCDFTETIDPADQHLVPQILEAIYERSPNTFGGSYQNGVRELLNIRRGGGAYNATSGQGFASRGISEEDAVGMQNWAQQELQQSEEYLEEVTEGTAGKAPEKPAGSSTGDMSGIQDMPTPPDADPEPVAAKSGSKSEVPT